VHERGRIENGIGGADDVELLYALDLGHAAALLRERPIDLLMLNAGAQGIAADGLSDEPRVAESTPLIVYGPVNGTHAEERWARIGRSRVVRRVESMDRLFDQAALLLHRDVNKLPLHQRRVLEELYQSNKSLAGKKVLVVDDDMRNIFALASVLEEYEMKILSADNGRDAIKLVQQDPGVNAVLMDIMMPEMDGLDTIRAIRMAPGCKTLPIIAVTAKAMKGDRDRCLEAGAWDYLSKPVDKEQLLATLRAWLFR